jgi:predicted amidohydrolase YtcJ
MLADGSLGARSALFFAPYEDDPSTAGLAIWPEEELCRVVGEVDRSGLQVFLHAIGDKAVHWALNAFERAAEKNGRRDARHRVEHAQAIQPADRARFAQLGVVASIQPSHCIDDMRWIEKRLGRRCEIAYPYRSLLDAGARIALGTDWYVEPLDPMLGLYAAVTREFPGGGPPGGWYPAEKVALEKAVEDYTLGSAFAEFQEREKGSIEVGKLADMVILSQDLFTIPPREILNTKVDATVLGGRVVYERGGTSGL